MRKIILMTALLIISGASMAQKVVVGATGELIIDNRGLPAKAITTAGKPRTTDGSDYVVGTNTLSNLGSPENNKTVSHYFEVMKVDFNNGTNQSWQACIEGCAAYDDKTWRLPTQREMMLIWTLQATLQAKAPDFAKFPDSLTTYWTATETNSYPWYLSTVLIVYNNVIKGTHFKARCIRDLTPPK